MLSEQECVDSGGHCYVRSTSAVTYGMGPTIYSRDCKHCNKKQIGKDQPSVLWVDQDKAGDDFIYRH